MGEWIEVDGQSFPVDVTDAKGAHIRLLVSPYDVPRAARGHYDPEHKRFRIELLYMTPGEPTEERDEGPLRLAVGKRSGRIYGIDVDVDALQVDAVGLDVAVQDRVGTALTRRMGDGRDPGRANAQAVQATLTSTPKIYRELAVAR
jgi:hypothetical protein